MKKAIYLTVGCIGLVLGAVAAAVPLLPSFPFLVLATYCFARGSQRMHSWFVGTNLYKHNLESFLLGRGMTKRAKLRVMLAVTAAMSIGFYFMGRFPLGRAVLAAIWAAHILYFAFGVKTITSTSE